jgi:(p)ppGpp synthase/HD superfamily hydrolase
LHDTIEDTETTLEELQQEFGSRVAGIHFIFVFVF